jgi:hypothetical protein
MRPRRIDQENFLLLTALQNGVSLGEALENAFRESDLSAEDQEPGFNGISHMLLSWVGSAGSRIANEGGQSQRRYLV